MLVLLTRVLGGCIQGGVLTGVYQVVYTRWCIGRHIAQGIPSHRGFNGVLSLFWPPFITRFTVGFSSECPKNPLLTRVIPDILDKNPDIPDILS